jgi:hypothetical protein
MTWAVLVITFYIASASFHYVLLLLSSPFTQIKDRELYKQQTRLVTRKMEIGITQLSQIKSIRKNVFKKEILFFGKSTFKEDSALKLSFS